MEWTQLERGDINSVISEWRQFLNEDPDSQPMRFRIYHSSLRDFLEDEVALAEYDRAVALSALGKIPGFLDGDQ
jgi:hypothetical protein